ncbi:hypothetical protein, partial [Weissella confusa]|uniref:hypothetical protein n=1 Tax=Weissella confusa TaxID=1583 RepID=UPI001A7EC422
WLQLVCPFLFLHPKQKKGTNNQSRERVVISTKYFRTEKTLNLGWVFFCIYYLMTGNCIIGIIKKSN